MEDHIWDSAIKRLTNTEDEKSKDTLDNWLASDKSNKKTYDEIVLLWQLSGKIKPTAPKLSFEQFVSQLPQAQIEEVPVKRLFPLKYIAAAVMAGVFVMIGYRFTKETSSPVVKWVEHNAKAGQVIKVVLPDSSLVWINADSKISYVAAFNKQKTRLVKLVGEAYFDVKHNAAQPFVVETNILKTTVHGTSFSVRAYHNEVANSVAVNSGKVEVQSMNSEAGVSPIFLLPNEKISYNSINGAFTKSSILNQQANAWVEGKMVFDQAPILEVVEAISRKYNVEIDASALAKSSCKLTANFDNQSIDATLKALNLSLNIQSNKVGQTIYLKGGHCM